MTTMARVGWWIISLLIGVMIAAMVVVAMALAIRAAGFGIGPAAYLVPPLALAFGTAGAYTLIERHFLSHLTRAEIPGAFHVAARFEINVRSSRT